MLKHIPNALTLMRLILAPVIAWLLWAAFDLSRRSKPVMTSEIMHDIATCMLIAAALFVVAALTDLFDGMAARAFNAQSKLGRIIDPIADKALVGLPLIAFSISLPDNAFPPVSIIAGATAVIVIRDVMMTAIRLTSPDGEGARVSSLAKWKTALELLVVGSMLVLLTISDHLSLQALIEHPDFYAPPAFAEPIIWVWLALLVITAALSAYTGWQYLRPAKKGGVRKADPQKRDGRV